MIAFVSEAYTLKDDTTWDGQIITYCELVFKAQYLIYIQEKRNWYWDKKHQEKVIIVPTWTIVQSCLDVMAVKDVHDITRSV